MAPAALGPFVSLRTAPRIPLAGHADSKRTPNGAGMTDTDWPQCAASLRNEVDVIVSGSRCPEPGLHELADILLCGRHYHAAREWAARVPRRERGIVYYLLRSDGQIKIGTTENYADRSGNLRREHGPLRLMTTEEGGRDRETQMHRRFRDLCVWGEWFRPELPLLTHIALLRRRLLYAGAVKPDVGLDEVMAMIRALGSDWQLPASRKGPQRWRGGVPVL